MWKLIHRWTASFIALGTFSTFESRKFRGLSMTFLAKGHCKQITWYVSERDHVDNCYYKCKIFQSWRRQKANRCPSLFQLSRRDRIRNNTYCRPSGKSQHRQWAPTIELLCYYNKSTASTYFRTLYVQPHSLYASSGDRLFDVRNTSCLPPQPTCVLWDLRILQNIISILEKQRHVWE